MTNMCLSNGSSLWVICGKGQTVLRKIPFHCALTPLCWIICQYTGSEIQCLHAALKWHLTVFHLHAVSTSFLRHESSWNMILHCNAWVWPRRYFILCAEALWHCVAVQDGAISCHRGGGGWPSVLKRGILLSVRLLCFKERWLSWFIVLFETVLLKDFIYSMELRWKER